MTSQFYRDRDSCLTYSDIQYLPGLNISFFPLLQKNILKGFCRVWDLDLIFVTLINRTIFAEIWFHNLQFIQSPFFLRISPSLHISPFNFVAMSLATMLRECHTLDECMFLDVDVQCQDVKHIYPTRHYLYFSSNVKLSGK